MTNRILTTHTGSLPRPKVVELLLHEQKPGAQAAKLKDAVREAVAEVVEAGCLRARHHQ